jgi:hypothetical protein
MDIIAILVTIIGLLLVLEEAGILAGLTAFNGWIIAVIVLIIGIGKLIKKL